MDAWAQGKEMKFRWAGLTAITHTTSSVRGHPKRV